jgi:hypothetical protein
VDRVFGSKARVPVKGTMNGIAFKASLFPEGDGTHYQGDEKAPCPAEGIWASSSRSDMYVNESLRRKARFQQGEVVAVMLEADTVHRAIRTPQDLKAALARDPRAAEQYAQMSYSHRKAYVEWIETAKHAETRARRIEKAVEMIRGGKPLKG